MKQLLLTLLLVCSTAYADNWKPLLPNEPNGIWVNTDIEFSYNPQTKFIHSFDTWIKRSDGVYFKAVFNCRADTMTVYEKGKYINLTNLDPSSVWWRFYKWGCNLRF